MKSLIVAATIGVLLPMLFTAPVMAGSNVKESNNAFACDLYQTLSTNQGDNIFFSPASISEALMMAWTGAQGITAQEMKSVLHLQGQSKDILAEQGQFLASLAKPNNIFTLRIANRLWGQEGDHFMASFLNPLKKNLHAPLMLVDFQHEPEQARHTINNWVSDQTATRIPELLSPGTVTTTTRLILANAAYFKGPWENKFQPTATKDGTFFKAQGPETIPFMHQINEYDYLDTGEEQVLALPYADRQLEMLVILPHDQNGLENLEAKLSPQTLTQWQNSLKIQSVRISLPRFQIKESFTLKDALSAMGMPSAFLSGQADFSGMTGKRNLFISKVIHKSFIQVDEEGTEAAAATAVIMERTSAALELRLVSFTADHPFLFLIIHRPSNTILFMGRMANPSQ